MSATQENRPTFGTYWRRNKDDAIPQSLVFVQTDPSQSNSKAAEKTGESEQSAKTKRRAQVRKAQIQHRARKANYTKQLEADINAIREQIQVAEQDRCVLRTENQAIRARLSRPQHHAVVADYGQLTGNPSFYATSTSYPQDEVVSWGFGIASGSLEYFNVADTGLDDMFAAPDGSPAYASSSMGSSGVYGSPQYMDSGSNTPYPLVSGANAYDQSHMLGFSRPGR